MGLKARALESTAKRVLVNLNETEHERAGPPESKSSDVSKKDYAPLGSIRDPVADEFLSGERLASQLGFY